MFRKIREILGRDRPPSELIEIRFDEVPAWLDGREAAIRKDLTEATAPACRAIIASIGRLRRAVASLPAAEQVREMPPRLVDVTRKALPQFTRSMSQILAKELPENAEEFYTTAAEMLKGAVRTVRGQGKYLATAYPEEMREIRDGIRDFGRGINAMTGMIDRYRTGLQQVNEIRRIHDRMSQVRTDYAAILEQIPLQQDAVAAGNIRIADIREALSRREQEGASAARTDLEAQIRGLEQRKDEIARRYASLRVTAVRVFGRGAKVAERGGDRAAARRFRRVLELLDDPDLGEGADRTGSVAAAIPDVMALLGRGDLVLKNREERRLFSDTATLPDALGTVELRYREVLDGIRAASAGLAASADVVEEQRLRKALADSEAERDEASSALTRNLHQLEEMKRSYEGLREDLQRRIGEFAGDTTVVAVEELPAAPS